MTQNNTHKYSLYKKTATDVSKQYFDIPGLLYIIWIGSSSYGIYDSFADIDIKLICENGNSNFEMKQFKINDIKIEVDKASPKWLLQKTDPDSEQFWIREKAHVLYDPNGQLKNIFVELNRYDKEIYEKKRVILYRELFQSYNFEKTIKRNDPITSWMLLFKTLDALSKFCFIYYDKPIPTFKWRWYFIKKEHLLKPSFLRKITLFDSKNYQQTLLLLRNIEKEAQQMMRKKNYAENFVKEPWLFTPSE